MSGHGKRRGHAEEEHENHERWLVTYADMLTLLMVLFIVLFAMGQVDKKKFAALKSSLASGFGAPTVAFVGSEKSIDDSTSTDSPLDVASGVGEITRKPEDQALKAALAAHELAKEQRRQESAKKEVENLEKIKETIAAELRKQGTTDSVHFAIDERGLIVTVITSAVVFQGDRAELLPDGARILNAIGPAIAPIPNRIEVDGHTNQLNIPTVNYPSGWELSTARASTVVRYLHANAGIPENRLAAVGFADTKPLYAASDPRSVSLNRRVEIVVLTLLPATESALLPSALGVDSTTNHSTTDHSTTTSESSTESGGHK